MSVLDSLINSNDAFSGPILVVTVVCLLLGVVSYFLQVMSLKSGPPKVLPLQDFEPFKLIEKDVLSHDTCRFTFGLPEGHVLGLPTGQHVSLKFTKPDGTVVQRSYTPVTDNRSVGKVALVIKIYRKAPPRFPDGGAMSQHLDSLKIGDTILMRGPKGHMEYFGAGKFQVKPLGKPLQQRSSRQLAMIAGGTGITPMLQVLHAIFRDTSDKTTRVRLLYANQTPDDILVRPELEALHEEFPDRFDLWYTVDRDAGDKWKYSTGFVTKEMIQEHLEFDSDKESTQFLLCGPPIMISKALKPALQELGYSDSKWVIF